MAITPPLQIVVVRHAADADLTEFGDAIVRAVKGGPGAGGYIASGEDLGIELRVFDGAPALAGRVAECLDGACHTVVAAIVGPNLVSDGGICAFLDSVWRDARGRAPSKHTLLIAARDDATARDLLDAVPILKTNQVVVVTTIGERAVRPALLSIRVLHEARKLLVNGLAGRRKSSVSAHLTLFISHAKLDGLPLAQSLQFFISTIPWLRSFYDAKDLAGETDWEAALEKAARASLLVILRTEIYEHRTWCQKEALWAEEAVAPTVLVEARPGLSYPAGDLPLERMPSVRIPDGNLFRILNAAIRESIRYLLFQRRIVEMSATGAIAKGVRITAFSYPPSMSALLRACRKIGKSSHLIIYPDPPLRTGLLEAANALVASLAPRAVLTTPSDLVALKP